MPKSDVEGSFFSTVRHTYDKFLYSLLNQSKIQDIVYSTNLDPDFAIFLNKTKPCLLCIVKVKG